MTNVGWDVDLAISIHRDGQRIDGCRDGFVPWRQSSPPGVEVPVQLRLWTSQHHFDVEGCSESVQRLVTAEPDLDLVMDDAVDALGTIDLLLCEVNVAPILHC